MSVDDTCSAIALRLYNLTGRRFTLITVTPARRFAGFRVDAPANDVANASLKFSVVGAEPTDGDLIAAWQTAANSFSLAGGAS